MESFYDYYIGDNGILFYENTDKPWLTYVDLKKKEWRWIKQLDHPMEGNGMSFVYNNNIYCINWESENNVGARIFNLENFTEDYLSFDCNIPQIGLSHDKEGHLTGSWRNPSDGNIYYVSIDIQTGHGEITMEEPDMYYDTLIPLN